MSVHNRFAALGLDEDEAPENIPPLTPTQKSDLVSVHHRVVLAGAHSVSVVQRHTPLHELQELPNIINMHNEYRGSIEVSPARSATSQTESNVAVQHMEWYERFRDFLLHDRTFYDQFKRVHEPELLEDAIRKQEEKAADLEEFTKWVTHAYGIRNIEDFAIKRMRKALKIPEKAQVTHATVVDRFIAQYSFPVVTKQDLQSLKSSQLRTDANRTFHLDIIYDEEKINRIWRVLKSTIDDVQTRERYERLLRFGRGMGELIKKS